MIRCSSALVLLLAAGVHLAGCGGDDEIDSDEAARQAYLGLDLSIGKALQLGMDGFNEASSANIPPQMTTGDVSGTLGVSGQVDMGASANKEMRLVLDYVDYRDEVPEDDPVITYETEADTRPMLNLSLRDIPDGTFTGTLIGTVLMNGDLEGAVDLDLALSGDIEPDPADATKLRRVPGTTTVTGTATSSYGTYDVDVTI